MKKLIINADDFGLSKKFNKGILELIDRGIVTSITVMVNRKSVEPKELLKRKNISIGLHLELSPKIALKEIEKQIKKFERKFNQPPSHLDSHKHCHLLPSNLQKVLKTARKYDLPVRSVTLVDRKTIKQFGIKTPSQYVSWHPARKEKFLENIRKIKRGTTEMVCHPGYFDPKANSNYNKQRKRELGFLKSRKFKKAIKSFELANYLEF